MRWHADDVTDPTAASPNDHSTSPLPGEWPVALAATDRGVLAVRGGMTWYAIGFDAASGACRWKQLDNGEGGFGVTAAGNELFLQYTNCSPLRVDPTTGTATAWLDPMATPDRPGDWQNDFCHSYSEFAIIAAHDTLIGAAYADVVAAHL